MSNTLRVIIFSSIFGLILFGSIIYFISKFSIKRKAKLSGIIIEQSIDSSLPVETISKIADKFVRDKKLQFAIIYYFYAFRSYCQEMLVIRHAKTIDHIQLRTKIAGTSIISLNDYDRLTAIYEKAKFTNNEISFQELFFVRDIVHKILATTI